MVAAKTEGGLYIYVRGGLEGLGKGQSPRRRRLRAPGGLQRRGEEGEHGRAGLASAGPRPSRASAYIIFF